MTGLEKILAQIKSDADSACADIKNRTDAKCADILDAASAQASLIEKAGEEDALRKSEDIIARAKSTAELEKRAVMLRVKQELIADALQKAREYLCGLPSDKYFELILKMAEKYSEDRVGELCFSKADLARIPEGFEKKISSCVKGSATVSTEPVDIDGGFILKYGGIEINCSFSSIFSAESERFNDEVAKILFA